MNATFLWICQGVIPLGALGGGLLATWLGPRWAVLVCACGIWAAVLPLLLPDLRTLRDVPAA